MLFVCNLFFFSFVFCLCTNRDILAFVLEMPEPGVTRSESLFVTWTIGVCFGRFILEGLHTLCRSRCMNMYECVCGFCTCSASDMCVSADMSALARMCVCLLVQYIHNIVMQIYVSVPLHMSVCVCVTDSTKNPSHKWCTSAFQKKKQKQTKKPKHTHEVNTNMSNLCSQP